MKSTPRDPALVIKGQPYPHRIASGLMFDAFTTSMGNLLRIGLLDMNRQERRDYRRGPVRFGLATDGNAIVTLWKFGAQPWCDAPYSALALRERNLLDMPTIAYDSHLVITLHLVDTATGLVEGLRAFTLGPSPTWALAGAAHEIIDTG